MAKDNDSSCCSKHCALGSSNSNYRSASSNETLPISPNPDTYMFSVNVGSKNAHTYEAGNSLPWQPPSIQTFLHQESSSPLEKINASFSESCLKKDAGNAVSVFVPKKFLIFDCSGNQTRVILDPPCYNHAQKPSFMNPISSCEFQNNDLGGVTPKVCIMKSVAVEEIDENHTICEESEMHEDTEEIDALLYSSDDDSFSEDFIDDDERSTGHYSPLESNEKKQVGILMGEEAATSDARPIKKLRLLNGGSLSVKPSRYCNNDDDVESTHRKCQTGLNMKRSRRDMIREKLRILETLILGGMGKDPLVVLDEAIKYLVCERKRGFG